MPALLATLGASPAILGLIEGLAESVASFAKLFSGYITDRIEQRKPLVVAGYFVANAVKLGATLKGPVTDMFWGDRYGKFTDPFGHQWGVATHVEDVSPEEMQRRSVEWSKQMAKAAGQSS